MITIRSLLAFLLSSAPVATAQQAPAGPSNTASPASTATAPPARPTAAAKQAAVADAELLHELVASETLARGDVDAWMQQVMSLLAGPHTAGAIDEAALGILSQHADELNEPHAWHDAIQRLQSLNGFDPHARWTLSRLARELRLAHMDHAALERAHDEDQFPEYVADFRILAPLDGPDVTKSDEDLFAKPGFDGAHKGLRDLKVEWNTGRRDSLRTDISPQDWIEPNQGWALLAFEFDLPLATAAAVEIDTRLSWGRRVVPYLMSIERPWSSVTGDPTWQYSVNGARPVVVDPVGHEIDPIVLVPAQLSAGRNRVLVWCRTDAHPSFAVRVLLPEGPERTDGGALCGRPLVLNGKSSTEMYKAATLADAQRIATPSARLPHGTPEEMALLGASLLELRPIQGLSWLRQATEAAPADPSIASMYAQALQDSPYLPEVWRRSAARTLFEDLAKKSNDLVVELILSRAEVTEDHEEDALARLERARTSFAKSPLPLIELARVYPNLEMDVPAEQARDAALGLAPHAPSVLDYAAKGFDSEGLHARALALMKERREQTGADPESMASLSTVLASAGDIDGAAAALRDARLRAGGRRYGQELADFLFEHEHTDEADSVYAELAKDYPRWEMPWLRRAEIARRRSDAKQERELLDQALRRDPSSEAARSRLLALGVHDRTEELFARYGSDREAVMKSYDEKKWNDHIVRVLDSSVLRVFPDGSSATMTHDILQVKDLDGCKDQGTQRISGKVDKIVTIKSGTGVELEPVDVDGEYVMPSLKPGDFIERIHRDTFGFPEEGARALESWQFASGTEPYHVSRFVVILPRNSGFVLEQHAFDGTHTVTNDGDDEVHVFEVRDRDRLQHEPGSPPIKWLVPWVQFGKHWDFAAEAQHELFQQSRLATRVTPEVRALAEKTVKDIAGDEARATALYDAVRAAVKKPNTGSSLSATATLLGEAGNTAYLFASLLEAAGIDHELGWSRDASPEAALEPEVPFPSAQRWQQRLLVHVMPKDASPAWCDLAVHDLPYGKILGNASRAEVMTAHGIVSLPELAPDDVRGAHLTIALEVQADGGAKADVKLEQTGNFGYVNKDRYKETPEAKRKTDAGRTFAGVLPGFELIKLENPGLDDDQPLALVGHGSVKKFLDSSDTGTTAKLPMPDSALTRGLAGGEGERKFPYYLRSTFQSTTEVVITLPDGMHLADGPPATSEEWHGCGYALNTDTSVPGKIKLTRTIRLMPFLVQPEEYAGFAAFCAKADEVERVPLRFLSQ